MVIKKICFIFLYVVLFYSFGGAHVNAQVRPEVYNPLVNDYSVYTSWSSFTGTQFTPAWDVFSVSTVCFDPDEQGRFYWVVGSSTPVWLGGASSSAGSCPSKTSYRIGDPSILYSQFPDQAGYFVFMRGVGTNNSNYASSSVAAEDYFTIYYNGVSKTATSSYSKGWTVPSETTYAVIDRPIYGENLTGVVSITVDWNIPTTTPSAIAVNLVSLTGSASTTYLTATSSTGRNNETTFSVTPPYRDDMYEIRAYIYPCATVGACLPVFVSRPTQFNYVANGDITTYDDGIKYTVTECQEGVAGSFCRAAAFLFSPDEQELEKFETLSTTFMQGSFMGYARELPIVWDEMFVSTTSTTSSIVASTTMGTIVILSREQLAAVPFVGLIKILVMTIFWIGIGYGAYRRVIGVFGKVQTQ